VESTADIFLLLAPNPGQITPQVSSKKRSGGASAEASPLKKKRVQVEESPARSLCGSNVKTSARVRELLAAAQEEKEPGTPTEKGSQDLTPVRGSSDEGSELEGEGAAERSLLKGTLSADPVEDEIPPVVQPEDEVAETEAQQ